MEIYLNRNKVFYIEDEVEAISGLTYEIGERIGSGGNGAVYECIDQSGMVYAIKFLLYTTSKSKARFKQEIALMQKLDHPHIIKYIDSGTVKGRENKRSRQEQEILFVVMEKADSNLKELLVQAGTIAYDTYAPQFRGMSEALKEIHKFAIHRDIKPENILIKGETWAISDFGLCEFLNPEERVDITGENEKVGPIFWISPEAVNKFYFGENEIGTYSDVYQLGMIFAFVLMRKYPGGIIDQYLHLGTTEGIKKLVLDTLNNDYSKRPQNGSELFKRISDATLNDQPLVYVLI